MIVVVVPTISGISSARMLGGSWLIDDMRGKSVAVTKPAVKNSCFFVHEPIVRLISWMTSAMTSKIGNKIKVNSWNAALNGPNGNENDSLN